MQAEPKVSIYAIFGKIIDKYKHIIDNLTNKYTFNRKINDKAIKMTVNYLYLFFLHIKIDNGIITHAHTGIPSAWA